MDAPAHSTSSAGWGADPFAAVPPSSVNNGSGAQQRLSQTLPRPSQFSQTAKPSQERVRQQHVPAKSADDILRLFDMPPPQPRTGVPATGMAHAHSAACSTAAHATQHQPRSPLANAAQHRPHSPLAMPAQGQSVSLQNTPGGSARPSPFGLRDIPLSPSQAPRSSVPHAQGPLQQQAVGMDLQGGIASMRQLRL